MYKKILKELLFNGANRSLRTKNGETARDLLEKCGDDLEEYQYESLSMILTEQFTCICFMRHRPIKKIARNSLTMLLGIVINAVVAFFFYGGVLSMWAEMSDNGRFDSQ